MAGLGVLGLLGIAALIPQDEPPRPGEARIRRELAAFRGVQVVLAMAMTVLGFGGVFAAITYIAPMTTEAAGYADGSVTWLLVLFGLGMVAGNLVGGRYRVGALLAAAALVLAVVSVTLERRTRAAAPAAPLPEPAPVG